MALTDIDRARRFMCFGSETGLITAGKPNLSKEKSLSIGRLICEGNGCNVVTEILECYKDRKYTCKPALLFSLACCFKSSDSKTQLAACRAFPEICVLPTDMFCFVEYCKSLSDNHKGWGRSLRTLISNWYNNQETMKLLEMVTRFKSACSWTHVDVLRLAHTNPDKDETAVILRYLMKGLTEAQKLAAEKKCPGMGKVLEYLEAVDTVKHATDEQRIAELIELHKLTKEHVPTKMLNSEKIWTALLHNMSLEEILPNIAKLAALGILNRGHTLLPNLLNRLSNRNSVNDSRVSPIAALIALRNYELMKGKVRWLCNLDVINALNCTFLEAIKIKEMPCLKKILVAVKFSHVMPQPTVRGMLSLSCLMASSGVASIFNKLDNCKVVFFSTAVTPVVTQKPMTPAQMCDALAQAAQNEIPVLACDVSAPIRWANTNKLNFDAFIILTDSRESIGDVTPALALQNYRLAVKNPKVQLVVCGLTSKQMSFADGNDAGMLDIAGFDATVPDTISKFLLFN